MSGLSFSKHLIKDTFSVLQAQARLEEVVEPRVLFVLDKKNKLVGSVSDGDIRRHLIEGYAANDSVELAMNKDFRSLTKGQFELEDIDSLRSKNIHCVPLLNADGSIDEILHLREYESLLPLTALIMAGGKGTRLGRLTEYKPKPLLTIGDKPILEYNIDRLIKFGIRQIYISVHYLKEQIMEYFGDGSSKGISIKYIEETVPLGTIGALSLVEKPQGQAILLMNADLLTNLNFEDMYRFYLAKNASVAIASVPFEVKIPYAVLETDGVHVRGFAEKPTYTYYSNAGIYIINPCEIQIIPKGGQYDVTEFISSVIAKKRSVVAYPVYCYWLDIGKPADYRKAQRDILNESVFK